MQKSLNSLLDNIIKEGLEVCEAEDIKIYTFAMYFLMNSIKQYRYVLIQKKIQKKFWGSAKKKLPR